MSFQVRDDAILTSCLGPQPPQAPQAPRDDLVMAACCGPPPPDATRMAPDDAVMAACMASPASPAPPPPPLAASAAFYDSLAPWGPRILAPSLRQQRQERLNPMGSQGWRSGLSVVQEDFPRHSSILVATNSRCLWRFLVHDNGGQRLPPFVYSGIARVIHTTSRYTHTHIIQYIHINLCGCRNDVDTDAGYVGKVGSIKDRRILQIER